MQKLAAGLNDVGFEVDGVAIDSARAALNPTTWTRVRSADLLVRVGFRPGARTWRGRAFDVALALFGSRATKACYWIGTDVLHLTEDFVEGAPVAAWRTPALGIDHHLAGSEPLQLELARNGVASSLVGFPWRTVQAPDRLPPLPEQFTVLTYIPDSRADFYGGASVLAVARQLPHVRFEVMGGEGTWANNPPPNLHFLGWVDDPGNAYSRATCVLRLVRHDSIGGTAVEGLLFGRTVLYSQHLEHTIHVSPDPDSVMQALAPLVEASEAGQLELNGDGAQWARITFDPVKRFEHLAEHLTQLADQRPGLRISYLTLQATTEGQAAHAHVHEIVRGLADGGTSVRVLKPRYAGQTPSVAARLAQFGQIQGRAVTGLRRSDAFYIRSHFAALPAALGARLMRTPVVQEVNGPHDDALVAWPALQKVRSLVLKADRVQMRLADAVITVTPQLVKWLKLDAGVDEGHLVSNGADVDLFSPHAERPQGLPERYVVFFGALAPWQGIEIALKATSSPHWPMDVALVVVGDGQMRESVERRSDGQSVIYLGRRPYADIPGIVAGSIASLMPMAESAQDSGQKSTRDHTVSGLAPLKMFESMACGVPVIASDLPGMAETIRRADCGLLVEAGSVTALAEAVRTIAGDPALAATMGANGRNSAVMEHSWRSRAEDTADVLRSVVARRRRRG
ncbi:glycosyltransferase family 4 protein [Terrabacter carboxydivorans]|uniref:glycosyltransferase family 4 protein n=1 Tax=Terrabacter carboxydivorans TaxID=619730 RepID=UPI0031DA4BCE